MEENVRAWNKRLSAFAVAAPKQLRFKGAKVLVVDIYRLFENVSTSCILHDLGIDKP